MDFIHVPQYSLPNGDLGKSVVIFCVDNSLSVHTDNRKNSLVFYQRPTDE